MTIAIVAAMESELGELRKRLQLNVVEEVHGISFFRGKLVNHDIVLVRSGIGKVNAALTAGILCARYSPELIVNTGCAGGLGDDDAPGDVIVATECTYGDVNATFFGYAAGQVPGMPKAYEADEQAVALLKECFEETMTDVSLFIEPDQSVPSSAAPNHRVRFGQLLTTDSFISDSATRLELKKNFQNGLAVDMEGCAIAQVAYKFCVPYIAVRALSDTAGNDASKTYKDHLDLSVRKATESVCLLLTKWRQ